MTRPITAGVDGSAESLAALAWAGREAVRRGLALRVERRRAPQVTARVQALAARLVPAGPAPIAVCRRSRAAHPAMVRSLPARGSPTHSSVRPAQSNRAARSRIKADAVSRLYPGREGTGDEAIEGLAG